MHKLMDERYPVYALADVTVKSRNVRKKVIVDEAVINLCAHLCGGDEKKGDGGHG
jgi:shikimate kinase